VSPHLFTEGNELCGQVGNYWALHLMVVIESRTELVDFGGLSG